ncbi:MULTISPECIES: DUF2516 family protein [unclassified Nocardioides]|uniref:DUF2516 family protein n=1 Tax=unclassified Nocardioides TaxID=2615069 RepID=UPI002666DA92|nr:DUF2516 family protein [Nocardioides sp. Arc9.136]WKN48044.1 DUF2516 family protein [Nocardioides sp. Arc9.136]
MTNVFAVEGYLMLLVTFVLLAVKIFAFVNALLHSAEEYEAAGKLTKPAWCLILGLGVVLEVVPVGLLLISIAFTIAAFVYLADVRPALMSLRRR